MATSADIDVSKTDLYEFLGLTQGPIASAKEINRAGRQTSFRYHPDKVEATPENLEKFHTAQIAISILTDPEQKLKYDQQREAKLRRKAEVDALDERRRKMAQDLENRENSANNVVAGQKRTFSEREMKIKMAQESNRRKMEERKAKARFDSEKQAAEERVRQTKEAVDKQPATTKENDKAENLSIRLRWVREGAGQGYDESTIQELFPSEDVESIILLKDKKRKLDGRGKIVMGTAVIIFNGPKAAANAMQQKGTFADRFESVEWLHTGSKDE